MADASFEDLMRAAYLQTFPAQLELIVEGDPADFLYIVIEGSVELFARANGRETTMTVVRPAGSFILAATLKDAVYLMSARTAQRSRVLLISSENVRETFAKDDAFARAIIVELAGCYRTVVKGHKDLKLRTAVERLANRLLHYHQKQGGRGAIKLPHDKRTIASLIGTTPENLSRTFNTLKQYGVEVDGKIVKLSDNDALARLAKPDVLIDDETS